jgi:anti-sigma regulatory factor (Ser/Thr protein kinase)
VSRLELHLSKGPEAAAEARRAVDRLAAHLQPDVLEDVRFLVNELVTNGVKYGAGPIEFRAEVSMKSVRVEVVDAGGGFAPLVEVPGTEQTSGRGLYLVDQIADRWGVVGQTGTQVWFEIDCVRS